MISQKRSVQVAIIQEIRLCNYDDVIETENQSQQLESQTRHIEKDHFYEFDSDEDCTIMSCIETEVNEMQRNMNALINIAVRKLFLECNTSISSGVPVQKLFSLGGLVSISERNRLTDSTFEKMLLMC